MNIFILTVLFGIIAGVIWELGHIIRIITSNNIISTIIVDFFCTCISGFLFVFCILNYNFGILRLYEIIGFLVGFEIVLLSIGNLVANWVNSIYNYICKFGEKLVTKRRSKKECKIQR